MGLKDPKHEKFATLVGGGKDPADAFVVVYGPDVPNMEAALGLLLMNPDIRQRIADAQDVAMEKALDVCDRVWLLKKLQAQILGAEKRKQYAAMLGGITLAARQPELQLFPQAARPEIPDDPFRGLRDLKAILEVAERHNLLRPGEKLVPGLDPEIEDAEIVEQIEAHDRAH